MALTLEDKKAIVAEVNEVASTALSAVAADYSELTVSDMNQLREKAREQSVYVRVIRNSLSRRAFSGTEFECMTEGLIGPLFVAFSKEAPGAAARLVRDFSKENDKLNVKLVAISGKLVDIANIDLVANLPTKDEAIAKLAYVAKAPVTQLARTLREVQGKLVRTISAIADQKKETS